MIYDINNKDKDTNKNYCTVDIDFVYKYLVCEFDHWDICLEGLVEIYSFMYFCEIVSTNISNRKSVQYALYPIYWTDECQEFLEDYGVAYKHLFFQNGKKQYQYNGWPLKWFEEKWQHRNPIKDQIKK